MRTSKSLAISMVVLIIFAMIFPFLFYVRAKQDIAVNSTPMERRNQSVAYMGENSNVNTLCATTLGALPCIGEAKILVFYTDFLNGSENWTASKYEVENLFFSEAGKTDASLAYTEQDSLRSYYYRSSYGKLDITGTVYEYQTQKDTSHYTSLSVVLDEIIAYYKDIIDWNEYDKNRDGYVDGVYVIARNEVAF